jgi:hypothetical protein
MSTAMSDHAVIVRFSYPQPNLTDLFQLEDRLEDELIASGDGECDGHELAPQGDATLFLYGPDADRLFEKVRPILQSTPFLRGAVVRLRYGPPEAGVREERVILGKQPQSIH